MTAKTEPTGLALLRAPFPEHQISKLPKPFKKDAPKGKCKPRREGGDAPDHQDHFCGGYHGLPAAHLDYVGHAAATDRMLDADPSWGWEPFARTDAGLPLFDQSGGLWINLTICGVTRPGYGHAAAKSFGDPGMREKEVIGDALRNAGMRFGMALDLWHKGDLHLDEEGEEAAQGQRNSTVGPAQPISNAQMVHLQSLIQSTNTDVLAFCKHLGVKTLDVLAADRFSEARTALEAKLAKMVKDETDAQAKEEA